MASHPNEDYQQLTPLSQVIPGACAHRDPTTGYTCGCRLFWRIGDEYVCYCSHHQCYHSPSAATGSPDLVNQLHHLNQLLSRAVPSPQLQPHLVQSQLLHLPQVQTRLQSQLSAANHNGLGLVLPNSNSVPSNLMSSTDLSRLPVFPDFTPPINDSDLPSTFTNTQPIIQSIETRRPLNVPSPNMPMIAPSLCDTNSPTPDLSHIQPAQIQIGLPKRRNEDLQVMSVHANQVSQFSDASASITPLDLSKSATHEEISNYLNTLRTFLSHHASQIKGLFDRMDGIEFASPNHSKQDEVLYEKLDTVETRIYDLESQIGRHERILNDSGKNESQASSNTSDIVQRLDDIEERMLDIERNFPPSSRNPIQLEVVFLPWGALTGLWTSAMGLDRDLHVSQDQEWHSPHKNSSNPQFTQSLSENRYKSHGWNNEAIQNWASDTEEFLLVAKACGTSSIIYHRLKSRGFVQEISVQKCDARYIQEVLMKSFKEILSIMSEFEQARRIETSIEDDTLLGLNASFIPLRKIRAQSKLSFLTKPEMVTPALWTWEFLNSSVLMRTATGPRRLYVTSKEGYLQTEIPGWTWDKIKLLPQQNISFDSKCWTNHDTIDKPPISNSIDSQQSLTPPQSPVYIKREKFSTPSIVGAGDDMKRSSREISPNLLGQITPITSRDSVRFSVDRLLARAITDELADFRSPSPLSVSDHSREVSPEIPIRVPRHKYNTRMARTVSTPISESTRSKAKLLSRSFSISTPGPSKRSRQFEPVQHSEFIMNLPTFVTSPTKKRRRLRKQRSSSSVSYGLLNIAFTSDKGKGKEANPYATPFSTGYDKNEHDNESEWEGLEMGDDNEHNDDGNYIEEAREAVID